MPTVNGRLICCGCGADLGDASDPYRDPDCLACLHAELETEVENWTDADQEAADRENVAVTMRRDAIRDRQ